MIVLQGEIDDKYGFGRCILLKSEFDSIHANNHGDSDSPFHSNHDNHPPFLSKRRNNQTFNQGMTLGVDAEIVAVFEEAC